MLSADTGREKLWSRQKPDLIRNSKGGYYYTRVVDTPGISSVLLRHRALCLTFKAFETADTINLIVNHKDGIKNNNHVSNLEIMTIKQNTHHAFETGLTPIGEKHSRSKFSDEKLREALEEIENGNSVNSVSKKHSISQSYLNKVKHGIYRSISTK
jgi:hypothetical protein